MVMDFRCSLILRVKFPRDPPNRNFTALTPLSRSPVGSIKRIRQDREMVFLFERSVPVFKQSLNDHSLRIATASKNDEFPSGLGVLLDCGEPARQIHSSTSVFLFFPSRLPLMNPVAWSQG